MKMKKMTQEKNTRQSNFELLRIISMFMIVIWHVLLNGVGLNTANHTLNLVISGIRTFFVVHVDSFILVTGYFQSTSQFHFKKVLSLIWASWFYRILSVVLVLCFSLHTLTALEIVKSTFILPVAGHHWFIHYYILLYLLSPFFNHYISFCTQKEMKRTLIVLLFINSCLPYLTNQEFFNNQLGFSLLHFVTLYFVGAYLRKYPLLKSYHFKDLTEKKFRNLMLFGFCAIAFINLAVQYLGVFIMNISSGMGSLLFEIGFAVQRHAGSYDFILTVIEACCYFLFFSTLHFKSKAINYFSTLMFGVYLFHESNHLKPYLYKVYPYHVEVDGILLTTVKIFFFGICLFFFSAFVEFLRQSLAKILKRFFSMFYSPKKKEKTRFSYIED